MMNLDIRPRFLLKTRSPTLNLEASSDVTNMV